MVIYLSIEMSCNSKETSCWLWMRFDLEAIVNKMKGFIRVRTLFKIDFEINQSTREQIYL